MLEEVQELIRIHVDLDNYAPAEANAQELLPRLSREQKRRIMILFLSREIVALAIAERRKVEREHDRMVVDQRQEARLLLSRETVCLPDGTRVRFGEMTAEQHELRAGWFSARIHGDTQAMTRHLEAAAELRLAGARCLDDIAVGMLV